MRGKCWPNAWCAIAVAGLIIGSCAVASLGRIRPSADVTRQFKELEINPNYNYWHLNQENAPFGVLGIDREYRFDRTSEWSPLDPDAATFRKVVGLVESFPAVGTAYTAGFEIMDHAGRQIGVWYSSINAGVTVDSAAKVVSVTTQAIWRKP